MAHLLSYKGMPEFITPGSREKSIYFWQAAHLFSSLALLIIAIKPTRTYKPNFTFSRVLPVLLLLTAATFGLYFGVLAKLDNVFVDGNQFTDTKLVLAYLFIGLNFIAAALYLKRIFEPRRFNTSALFAASFILGLAEYFYAINNQSRDIYNLLGHIYKIIGFSFLYRAVFVETLRNPYRQLRESRQQLRSTMQAMPDLVFEVDENYNFVGNYSAYTQGLYVAESMFMGKSVQDVMPPGTAEMCIKALDDARANGISRDNIICLPIDDKNRWFEMSISSKPMPDGQGTHFVVISRDITDRFENEKALRILSQAFSQSPIAFFITDVNHVIELCNQTYARLCNSNITDLIGKRPYEVPGVNTYSGLAESIIEQIERGNSWRGDLRHIDLNGHDIFLKALIFPVRNSFGEITNYITHLENITDQKNAQARIKQLSQYDQLTELPNTALLKKHYEYLCNQNKSVVVMWVDIDNFKDINDSLGYPLGDDLLRIVATRLSDINDPEFMVSRLSGDDFLIIKSINNEPDATITADQILAIFAEPVILADQEIYVTASIGLVISSTDDNEFDELLKKAELAKYKAKSLGRNNICFYEQDMQSNAIRFLELSSALKSADIGEELRMVYQPQFNMSRQTLIGAEALIRWHSPQWGNIAPEEFMRIAEASGMVINLGDWILRTTLKQVRDWENQGINGIRIAINLSPIQFNHPSLASNIIDLLNEYGLKPDRISLEITEAIAMANPKDAAKKIHELQALNINFAIDDFGTGYSSLSYLKRFKIKKLKIDKSFIKDLDSNDDDQAIVNAIIQMAKKLDILTIAEGVETLAQLNILKDLGCDEVQGFYFSKPLESDEFGVFAKKSLLIK